MLRIIHTADVHLGARHDDLGEQAAAQRERQFAAFKAAIDLALAEKVDLFLIAGDLFDSNVQPRRSVERVAAELKRLAEARIRSVIIPGTHDVYDRASIYRAYDLAALAGCAPDDDLVTVLDPEHPWVHLGALDAVVHGRVFATKRAPHSPLEGLSAASAGTAASDDATPPAATWRIGMVHGSIAIPGRTEHDEVVITTEEIAASGLDYLALGHWHSMQTGKAGGVSYAYAGAPEAVALDQDRAGKVLLVELDERAGKRVVTISDRQVGRTRFEKAEIDAATVDSQPALVALLAARADPDLVLDVRLVGIRRDELDLDPLEMETSLTGSFLKVRLRDGSVPALTDGPLPSPDTIAGAFIRDLEATDRRARDVRCRRRGRRGARRAPARPAAARRPRGLAVRVRRLHGRDFRRYRDLRHRLRARPDGRPRPERIGQEHRPARARAGPDAAGDEHGRRARVPAAVGRAAGGALDHHPRVRAGRGRRPEGRHAREDVRRLEGHRPARLRRPGDHRPDPRRPGHGRADRHPDRGLLPLDRVGPPFRAERPVARRRRAARPPPGLDQRRRPRAPAARARSSTGRSTT